MSEPIAETATERPIVRIDEDEWQGMLDAAQERSAGQQKANGPSNFVRGSVPYERELMRLIDLRLKAGGIDTTQAVSRWVDPQTGALCFQNPSELPGGAKQVLLVSRCLPTQAEAIRRDERARLIEKMKGVVNGWPSESLNDRICINACFHLLNMPEWK